MSHIILHLVRGGGDLLANQINLAGVINSLLTWDPGPVYRKRHCWWSFNKSQRQIQPTSIQSVIPTLLYYLCIGFFSVVCVLVCASEAKKSSLWNKTPSLRHTFFEWGQTVISSDTDVSPIDCFISCNRPCKVKLWLYSCFRSWCNGAAADSADRPLKVQHYVPVLLINCCYKRNVDSGHKLPQNALCHRTRRQRHFLLISCLM